jgi:hypothetical protein
MSTCGDIAMNRPMGSCFEAVAGGLFSSALALAGCADDETGAATSAGAADGPCVDDRCGFSFRGSSFDDYEGKTLYWGLQVQGEMGLVYQDHAVITAGAFEFRVADVLDQGQPYNLNYFVDINVQHGTTIDVEPDSSEPSNLGCSGHP